MPRILLVDDDDTFREMLRLTIEGMGHEVIGASNGAEAISRFPSQGVDLVITDLLMPEKDGFEMIRFLRKRAPKVRVVAMSGGGRVGPALYLDVAKQLGAERTLMKPFSKSDLETAIKNALLDSPSITNS